MPNLRFRPAYAASAFNALNVTTLQPQNQVIVREASEAEEEVAGATFLNCPSHLLTLLVYSEWTMGPAYGAPQFQKISCEGSP